MLLWPLQIFSFSWKAEPYRGCIVFTCCKSHSKASENKLWIQSFQKDNVLPLKVGKWLLCFNSVFLLAESFRGFVAVQPLYGYFNLFILLFSLQFLQFFFLFFSSLSFLNLLFLLFLPFSPPHMSCKIFQCSLKSREVLLTLQVQKKGTIKYVREGRWLGFACETL